jgi:hypothetical protein
VLNGKDLLQTEPVPRAVDYGDYGNPLSAPLFIGFTCSMVHCFGSLSGRQRKNLVP